MRFDAGSNSQSVQPGSSRLLQKPTFANHCGNGLRPLPRAPRELLCQLCGKGGERREEKSEKQRHALERYARTFGMRLINLESFDPSGTRLIVRARELTLRQRSETFASRVSHFPTPAANRARDNESFASRSISRAK